MPSPSRIIWQTTTGAVVEWKADGNTVSVSTTTADRELIDTLAAALDWADRQCVTVEVDDRTHEDPPTAEWQPDEDYGGWTETRSAFSRPIPE